MKKPFSLSADRNKKPIFSELQLELFGNERVLEVASGTGQHACFFAAQLPNLTWQPSELEEQISGIKAWISELNLANILEPIVLDVNAKLWSIQQVDVCYTSNSFHIVSMESIVSIFNGCKQVLSPNGKLIVYGPFKINGEHVSQSNKLFDRQLRASNPDSGVRDLHELDTLAQSAGFSPQRSRKMPANNLLVVWDNTA